MKDDAADEADSIIDWLKFSWSEYLKWFAFLCTLNVAGIGVLRYVEQSSQVWFDFVFAMFNIGGFITSITLSLYSSAATKHIRRIDEANRISSARDGRVARQHIASVPLGFGMWCAFASFCAMLQFCVIWLIFLTPHLLAGPLRLHQAAIPSASHAVGGKKGSAAKAVPH